MIRALFYGFAIWLLGTLVIRFAGAAVLHLDAPGRTAILYLVSFALMAWAMPRLCNALDASRYRWFEATALIMLPTLVLDPWACLFFRQVYPNLNPAAAGIFGGWMLVFCAGAVAGVWWTLRKHEPGREPSTPP